MPDEDVQQLAHPPKTPLFEFEPGQFLRHRHCGDYWHVDKRLWCYDPSVGHDTIPDPWDHRQYVISEVITLGAESELVSEDDLRTGYALVDEEEVSEVLDIDG
jgi:hypothetical protein